MEEIKIPCGGWYVDNKTLIFDENKVLSVVGGGGASGVSSFNGRTGAVTPQAGDYTAEQVGAVSLSGGTMTGNLILNGDPTNNLQAATKQYVDVLGDTVNDIIDGTKTIPYLPDNGGTLTGALNMGSQKITGLADATDPGDALNKKVGDATYALKTAIPTNATTATAGIVKQATAIEDSSGATDTVLETKFNALLAALRTAGVLASS